MGCAVSSSSVEQCALCADSTRAVHHAIVEVNVVIGVLVVHCELLVVRVVQVVVCDDAVVRRTLVLTAFIVAFVFVVAILHRILLYWRYSVYIARSVKSTRKKQHLNCPANTCGSDASDTRCVRHIFHVSHRQVVFCVSAFAQRVRRHTLLPLSIVLGVCCLVILFLFDLIVFVDFLCDLFL